MSSLPYDPDFDFPGPRLGVGESDEFVSDFSYTLGLLADDVLYPEDPVCFTDDGSLTFCDVLDALAATDLVYAYTEYRYGA